jgi:hypothetical protein
MVKGLFSGHVRTSGGRPDTAAAGLLFGVADHISASSVIALTVVNVNNYLVVCKLYDRLLHHYR